MWRPSACNLFRKTILSSAPALMKQNTFAFYKGSQSSKGSTLKLTLVSAGVGVLIGAGYGGYTHYKINYNKHANIPDRETYTFLEKLPEYKPQYKVVYETDNSNLKLVLFQYRTCPFCCKVRAYLDSRGISYDIVEVDAVLRQAIKWSGYKKVPILLAKVDGGYQQLLDSTAIISILETYSRDESSKLSDIVKFYPATQHTDDSGKSATEIANKYFIMHNAPVPDENERNAEKEEREWRQWADSVLVHILSPNVYRTMGEALETFKWFEEVGGWKSAFPSWECALMVYGGATAMWLISKRLQKRHNISNPRQSLYDASHKWINAVKRKGTPFMGGDRPNLADITVYGILSSIEGCHAFQDLRHNTDIGNWYDSIKSLIESKKVVMVAPQA